MSLEDFLMVEISKDDRFENMFARKFAKNGGIPIAIAHSEGCPHA